MTNRERSEKILAAARLFCHGQTGKRLKKKEIAKALHTTPAQVTRWIEEAEDKNIIQYLFAPPRLTKLEIELKQQYPFLRHVIVLSSVEDFAIARLLRGRALAQYFEENVKDGMTVAVAGGNTLYEMVLALPERERSIDITPAAVIGRGPTIDHIDPSVLVTILWAKSGGKPTLLGKPSKGARAHSTSIYSYESPDARTPRQAAEVIRRLAAKLCRQGPIKSVLDRSKSADVLFTSSGPLEVELKYQPDFANTTLQLLENVGITKSWLKAQGIVGDICYSPIDETGRGRSQWQFFASISPEDLRLMSSSPTKSIVLTAGAYTTQGVRAALAGKLCNVLVIDENEANDLIRPT